MILLNPGPVTLSERVRQALVAEDMCHREPEFAELMLEVRTRLETVYEGSRDAYSAVLLTGSGTCAVEAMLATFAPHDKETLVVANGIYGERMAVMLARQGKPHHLLRLPWLEGIEVAEVARWLNRHPGIADLAVVHHETTTARLNRLDDVAQLCREKGIRLLVDAVSSFGGELLPFDRWAPQAVASTANKCLHGVPGAAFVMVDRNDLERGISHASSLYLDLMVYYREQRDGGSPFTQSVHVFRALREALRELADQGGWQERHRRYFELSACLRECLTGMGVRPLIPLTESASMMTAFRLPMNRSYAALHDALKARGFVIYAGQGPLAREVFRIALMGAIGDEDFERLLTALRDVIEETAP